MTNYRVIFFGRDGRQVAERTYKIKHFRQQDGRQVSPNGGYTSLFDLGNGHVLVSKCRSDEQFSRKKGILTCLQKAINANSYREFDAFDTKVIDGVSFKDGELHVTLSSRGSKMFWWL